MIKIKKTIRCHFTDFWVENILETTWFKRIIIPDYEIVLDNRNPDYLFFSCFGEEHRNYPDCVKIFYCGENIEPDFNNCDYAISLSPIVLGDRNLRFYNQSMYLEKEVTPEKLTERKFCNFVYSNSTLADPFRQKIFHRLSEYKKVDSGGGFLNNIGGPVTDKLAFLSKYKFTLAIENCSLPGYSTEKIIHPFIAGSLPLYWGNPDIGKDYNPEALVNLMEFGSIEEAIEEIVRLDNNDEAYLEKLNKPFWPYGDNYDDFKAMELEKLNIFIQHIFDQPLELARRRALYGWNKMYVYPPGKPDTSLIGRVRRFGDSVCKKISNLSR